LNFLAIDTGGKYLSVIACREGVYQKRYSENCAMKHSVLLMDEIDAALREAALTPAECDFFAAVVGPGSFTGIRIGISTIKGLCAACGKPPLAITSFDCLAYAESGSLLSLVDAGHENYYACGYDTEKQITEPPAFLKREEVDALLSRGYMPVAAEVLFDRCRAVDPAEGLLRAATAKYRQAGGALRALYLRKSSAEENKI